VVSAQRSREGEACAFVSVPQKNRGRKIYSLHALEVECIGKGSAHRPYEFGVKASVATTLHRSKDGQCREPFWLENAS